MKLHLRVYENNHYMDESDAYDHGQYDTYEEAMIAAKAIVDEFFVQNWKRGMTPDDLLAQYSLYGDDPIILPNEHGEHPRFSASDYSEEIHESICKELED
jgi:hypothetical protein